MPAKPRSDIFAPDEVGVYHCWNRVTQRRHLLGVDPLTGKDHSHRKDWIFDRLRCLAGAMALDVLDFAILDNHIHVVLRNRPDIVATWSDEEVARRWWNVCPGRKNDDGTAAKPLPAELRILQNDDTDYRAQLSDISWFMRLWTQPIGYRANREDDITGRFFAKRFGCDRLRTVADVLACSVYVDLNVVSAGIAQTPEASYYTSVFARIRRQWRKARVDLQIDSCPSLSEEADPEAWLAPIFLDERAEAYQSVGDASSCNPVGSPRISNKGFLPVTLEQYLTLLDTIGRTVRTGKSRIPTEFPPILERLSIDPKEWFGMLQAFFQGRSAYRACAVP